MAETPTDVVPEVLFVCVHNAGRSQMAAALLAHHAGGRVVVRSAGSAPAQTVNPAVVEVMDELGIDVSREVPKKLLTEDVAASDVVVTMGCGDACPVCGDVVREVSFADSSLQYCPTCQTGGKPLADRRLSKLLK